MLRVSDALDRRKKVGREQEGSSKRPGREQEGCTRGAGREQEVWGLVIL